eukprot:CAMPEP_0173468968 /NCGR_PEP_ID=MMETSP1357-20121228/77120_1 /TAXON_ID=77926 /ORGANISM="Hemiselmis rufescens, Strain PCC563" /LENGTH=141 /DNA_ID=CAMNT_0014437195 /DNA_START=720 /DNA_END=1145 /DNA_ORIENTATION=-
MIPQHAVVVPVVRADVPPRPEHRDHGRRHRPAEAPQELLEGRQARHVVGDLDVVHLEDERLPPALRLPLLRRLHVLQQGQLERPSQRHHLPQDLFKVVLQDTEVGELRRVEEGARPHQGRSEEAFEEEPLVEVVECLGEGE